MKTNSNNSFVNNIPNPKALKNRQKFLKFSSKNFFEVFEIPIMSKIQRKKINVLCA